LDGEVFVALRGEAGDEARVGREEVLYEICVVSGVVSVHDVVMLGAGYLTF
jgi:hypothetical protein